MTTVLVAGGVVQRARHGGHVWAFAQWVLGLRALGLRCVFVDRVAEPSQLTGAEAALDLLGGAEHVSVLGPDGEAVYGMRRDALVAAARSADAVLNVMGYLDDEQLLAAPRRRIFLDIDPGFGQMWHALGLADVFAGHDVFVTVATRIDGSAVPTCGLAWTATLPPVFLPAWPPCPPRPEGACTSVASWRGPFGPIELDGVTYGLRVHELRRFVDAPYRSPSPLELALDIDPADDRDRAALLGAGWRLVDPAVVAGTPDSYRAYVQESKAELMVAKHLYVATHAGWFSDRSACYLASGRPVVAQDTGFDLPVGDGVLAFGDLAELLASLRDLDGRYDEHCDAARSVAEQHLAADVVLPRVLSEVLG